MTTLSTKQRASLPDQVFALPETRRYPIHDETHARNALARVAQRGTAEEQKRVRSAVHAKFPELGKESHMPLTAKIAGRVYAEDFASLESMFADDAVARALAQCQDVRGLLEKVASAGVPRRPTREDVEKTAMADLATRTDVVQVRPSRYGYVIKWAAAPDGTAPKEKEVSAPQAQQALPPEMLQAADQQGAATVTNVEAEPDPLVESPQPVEGFGMYKVVEAETGKELVGFVIPTLFDPRVGQPTPLKLFVSGGQFAIQPEIQGVLIAISYNLPAGPPEPRGLGVFYKTDGKSIIATVPYTVDSSVTVQGEQYYTAHTHDGQEIQISPSDGIKRPVMVDPAHVAMPVDYTWLPLDNEVALLGMTTSTGGVADPLAQEKRAAASTMVEIRAWRDGDEGGGVHLSGPVFEKNGSGTYDWADGVFWLACAGMPQNLSTAVLEKAASSGEVLRLYGLRPLGHAVLPAEETHKHADAIAAVPRPCLLREALSIEMHKEARELVGVDSLDTLLAVGLINQENIQDFVDAIPELEETQSKLASLVFATQLGLQSVPKTAAVHAMQALEKVIIGLKGLKSYQL